MRSLVVFNQVSLDGYIADAKGDMSWAHKQDDEWNTFVAGNAKGDAVLVFGRVTYEMMARWWPTPQAIQSMPTVADAMNRFPKVVFSRTLDHASWNNTRLVKGDMLAEIRKLKRESGPDLLIFGSGTVVSQLTQAGLIDEYQIVVNPVILGAGKSMFAGVTEKPVMKQTKTRAFGNGNVFLCYQKM